MLYIMAGPYYCAIQEAVRRLPIQVKYITMYSLLAYIREQARNIPEIYNNDIICFRPIVGRRRVTKS